MAFFLKAIGLSDDIPGFPFTPASNDPGRVVYTSPLLCWTVRSGTPHDDTNKKVSIFTCALPTSSATHNNELVKQLARNALRRAKSLMIPGCLRCLGATEYRDTVYIATEECVPLKEVLADRELRAQLYGATAEEYNASVAYGVHIVGEALSALHQNRLVHGNVSCNAVFVVPSSGVWRLAGLELVSPPEEIAARSAGSVFENAIRNHMLEGYHCPPEFSAGATATPALTSSAPSSSTSPAGAEALAVDSWGMACLLYEAVGITAQEAADGKLDSVVHTLSSADLRNACRQALPKSLHSGCSALTAANPKMRKTVQAFLESCEFVKDCPLVQYMKGLSEVLLLDATQQVRLLESLADVVDAFPLRSCWFLVLPRLSELIRSAAKPGSANGAAGVSIGPVVTPVLKIAARTSAGDDFDRHLTPVLLLMFQSNDVLMRYKLLVGADVYGGKLSASALNNAIWPLYAKGFQYTTPSVREYSARALVHLAPHLSETILGDQVPKALALLQRDQDGALRANATIALHLIAPHITPPTQRASVMLTYCRPMLRDAFEPSRVAALRSLRGAIECLSAKQLAEGVLPAVAPLTVDPTSEESRSAALALIKSAVTKLEEHHKHLTAQQPAVLGSAASPAASPTPSADKGNASPIANPNNNNNNPASSSVSSSTSWGWGLFNGSPPATPAPTSAVTTTAATASRPQHHDPTFTAAPASAAGATHAGGGGKVGGMASGASGLKSSPLPSHATVNANRTGSLLPAPVVATTAKATGGSGWSDDDDDEDGMDDVHVNAKTTSVSGKLPATTGVFSGSTQLSKPSKEADGWDDFDDEDDAFGDGGGDAAAPPTVQSVTVTAKKAPSLGLMTGHSTTTTSSGAVAPPPRAAAAAASPSSAVGGASSPSSTAFASRPLSQAAPTIAMNTSGSGTASPLGSSGSPTSVTGSTAATGGPMKLKKKGGLGAARLD